MQLDALREKGVIHIGLGKCRMIVYAYALPSRPDLICVGHDDAGVRTSSGTPVVPGVVDRIEAGALESPRFVMICHHSSAREIAKKIQDAMVEKGHLAALPAGAAETSREVWFNAKLDDVIYAYPPFAKIFLSELPSFAGAMETDPGERSEVDALEHGDRPGGRDRRRITGDRKGGEAEPGGGEAARWRDLLFLRHEGVRSLLALLLIVAIVFGIAFALLESMRHSESGRAWLLEVESRTGVALGANGERSIGFLTSTERDARRDRVERAETSFSEWYDPTRGNDTGRTFGLPRDMGGFDIRTWVGGPADARHVFAAYRSESRTSWRPRTLRQKEVSRRLSNALLRTGALARSLHADACDVISGETRYMTEPVARIDMLVVDGDLVLRAFSASAESCASGVPTYTPV